MKLVYIATVFLVGSVIAMPQPMQEPGQVGKKTENVAKFIQHVADKKQASQDKQALFNIKNAEVESKKTDKTAWKAMKKAEKEAKSDVKNGQVSDSKLLKEQNKDKNEAHAAWKKCNQHKAAYMKKKAAVMKQWPMREPYTWADFGMADCDPSYMWTRGGKMMTEMGPM